jgi:putative PIN family toxin of toxin-antitoxin system
VVIVIDSNVWISALVFGGNPRKVFERAVSDGWTIVTSEEIFTEVRRIVQQKFPDFIQDFEYLVIALQHNIFVVKLGSLPVSVSRDHNDDMVIETALIGGASHIITGDKDLLVVANFKSVIILSPQLFLQGQTLQ